MHSAIADKLAKGITIVLNGGTGTEIQRQGAPQGTLGGGGGLRRKGVSLFGGCCSIGPEYIRALVSAFKEER